MTGTERNFPWAEARSRLMADAHRRHFDALVVWKFDRLARSVSRLLRALETFRSMGIDFVSLSKPVDTRTPTGKMVFTFLVAVAELERSLIAERVKAGLRNARTRSKRIGCPPHTCLAEETIRLIFRADSPQDLAVPKDVFGYGTLPLRVQLSRRNNRDTVTTTAGNITRATTVIPTVDHSRRG